MELLSLVEAQRSLDALLKCPGLRCVLDAFAVDLSKNTREDIYVYLKDGGSPQVQRLCLPMERPRRAEANEVCYMVKLKRAGETQVLWRNERGQWKLSNASKRPLTVGEKAPSDGVVGK
ncbi:hypothetical protein ACNQKP_00425 [Bdellovibrio bacteriovorus]|uniref:hypothetical protein n=1 Tax=Bdellovibrio bacteriovorus TaxID=959 RepID=UPI003AA7F262